MRRVLLLLAPMLFSGCFLFGGAADPDAPTDEGLEPECRESPNCSTNEICRDGRCVEPDSGFGGEGGSVAPGCAIDGSEAASTVAVENARLGFTLVALGGEAGLLAAGAPGVCVDPIKAFPSGRVLLVGGPGTTPRELAPTVGAGAAQLGALLVTGSLGGRRVLVAGTGRLRATGDQARGCPPADRAAGLTLVVWELEELDRWFPDATVDAPPIACVLELPATVDDGFALDPPRFVGTDPVRRSTWTALLPGDLDGDGDEELVIGRPEDGSVIVAEGPLRCSGGEVLALAEATPSPPRSRKELASTGFGAALAASGRTLFIGAPGAGRLFAATLANGALTLAPFGPEAPPLGRYGAALAVSPDGATLAVGNPGDAIFNATGTLLLLDVPTGAERGLVQPSHSLEFSFGSALAFVASCDGPSSLAIAAPRAADEQGRIFLLPPALLEGAHDAPAELVELPPLPTRARFGFALAPLVDGVAAGMPDRFVDAGYAGAVRRYQAVAPQP